MKHTHTAFDSETRVPNLAGKAMLDGQPTLSQETKEFLSKSEAPKVLMTEEEVAQKLKDASASQNGDVPFAFRPAQTPEEALARLRAMRAGVLAGILDRSLSIVDNDAVIKTDKKPKPSF